MKKIFLLGMLLFLILLVNAQTDPTLLPEATGQLPASTAPGTSLSAGQSYDDPVTGIKVYKVTDGSTPLTNVRVIPDYAEGGPFISLPWGDPQMYTLVMKVRRQVSTWFETDNYLVDFNPSTGSFTNWRVFPGGNGDITSSFSNNPNTPQIIYYLNGETLHRYDTSSMQNNDIGLFPHTFQTGGRSGWLHQDMNDEWFTAMLYPTGLVAVWNSNTNVEYTAEPSGINEPHLDRAGDWLYMIAPAFYPEYGQTLNSVVVMDLTDGSLTFPLVPNSHAATPAGYFVAADPFQNAPSPEIIYNPSIGVVETTNTLYASGHRAGQWVVNNDPDLKQWYLISKFSDFATNTIQTGIGFVRVDASDIRLLAHHYSVNAGSDYYAQPHATMRIRN